MNILSYFFNTNPGQSFKYYIPMIALGVILILFGVIFSFLYKSKKKTDFAFKRLFKGVGRTSVLMGLLFLTLTAVRYETIPYFSMRIWVYLSLLLLLYLIYRYIKIFKTRYPVEKENAAIKTHVSETNEISYLPNKARKKRKKK